MKEKYNIFYIGLDPLALIAISKNNRLRISGAAYLPELIHFTLNPINWFFQLAYYFQIKKLFLFAKLFYVLWKCFSMLGSNTYKRYGGYLNYLINKKTPIIEDVDDKLQYFVAKNNIDLILICGWSILNNELLQTPKFGSINIHPSELPKYRGALPALWALKNHDQYSAVTYMRPDVSVDGGNILKQYRFDINKEDDSVDLEKKITNIIERTLASDLISYVENRISLVPQDPNIELSTTAKYEQYKEIKLWEETSDEIRNKVLSYPYLEPFCFCYLKLKNKKIIIKNINYYNKNDIEVSSGKYIVKKNKVFFGTKNGVLNARLFVDINIYSSVLLFIYRKK